MTDGVGVLLGDYVARFRRGEHPDPLDYRERAGAAWGELAVAIDRFLIQAPAPPASSEGVASMRALLSGSPPLLALRRWRGVTRSQVIQTIMDRFAIGDPLQDKVALRYHELESGLLPLARIDERVFRVIAGALGVERREVFAWRAPRVPAAVFARTAASAMQPPPDAAWDLSRLDQHERPMPLPACGPPDEVDAIFGTGS